MFKHVEPLKLIIDMNDFMVNISLCMKIEFMFRHEFIKEMLLIFYAHIYVFDADDELRLHKKGCKYKLLTEGSTGFQ
jgi:hypothetical protein